MVAHDLLSIDSFCTLWCTEQCLREIDHNISILLMNSELKALFECFFYTKIGEVTFLMSVSTCLIVDCFFLSVNFLGEKYCIKLTNQKIFC